ncbi:MAG: FlxA-like family protein [Clostridiales bacterium]|nr:FlxA-like family protein [Clostridiales bacterium]
MKINAANAKSASKPGNGEAAQIENQIRDLREQLTQIRANDKMHKDEKARKIKELLERIAALQEKLARAKQNASRPGGDEKSNKATDNPQIQYSSYVFWQLRWNIRLFFGNIY